VLDSYDTFAVHYGVITNSMSQESALTARGAVLS
jgi:hypothetical protein